MASFNFLYIDLFSSLCFLFVFVVVVVVVLLGFFSFSSFAVC